MINGQKSSIYKGDVPTVDSGCHVLVLQRSDPGPLFSLSLTHAHRNTLSVKHTHLTECNGGQAPQSKVPKSTPFQIRVINAWCCCWHSNLLSSLMAFLKAAISKGVNSFPFFFCHLLLFYTYSFSDFYLSASSSRFLLSQPLTVFACFPWESGSSGHCSDLNYTQWTSVCPQKPDRSPLVKIAQLTVKFQSS